MPGDITTIEVNGHKYRLYWWSNETETNKYKPIHVHFKLLNEQVE